MFKIIKIDGLPDLIKKDNHAFDIFVPEDPTNKDYQEYLAWIAEGNEPEVING